MRILIAQRSPLVRDLLVSVFAAEPGAEVVAPVASHAELLDVCRTRPGVVLAGTAMPDGDLAEVIAPALLTGARVLVVCEARDADAALPLLFAGAAGFLFLDDAGPGEIVEAARTVAAGHAALHPAAAAAVLQLWRAARVPVAPVPVAVVPAQRLTPRETEVLAALGCGLPTKLIGRQLGVSPKTAEAHIGRVLAKLAARNRAHAVSIALETGLLAPHDLAAAGAGRTTP